MRAFVLAAQSAADPSRDPALVVLALVIVVFCVAGFGVSAVYSVPHAVRRVRNNPEPGSAKRLFAISALFSTVIPTICLVLFLGTGITALLVADMDTRAAISRALLVTGIVLLCVMVIVVPILYRYTELAANREELAGSRGRAADRVIERASDRQEDKEEDRATANASLDDTNERIREMQKRGLADQPEERTDREEGHEHRADIDAKLEADTETRGIEREADRQERKEERREDREERRDERSK